MRTTCHHCGGSLTLPEGYSAATIRCSWCEAAAEVPANLRAKAKADEDDGKELYDFTDEPLPELPKPPVKTIPGMPIRRKARAAVFTAAENVGVPLLKGDTEERPDGPDTPYTVPGTGLKPCPECSGELPLAATFCVHCGTPLIGPDRQPVRRTYTPIDREWIDGWRPHFRRNLFFILLMVNAAAVLLGIWVTGADLKLGSVWLKNLAISVVPVFLQAFLLGTYGTLRVIRTRERRCEVWRTWRFAFIPMKPKPIPLAGCAGTGRIVQVTGFAEFVITFTLLPLGLVPGLLFLAMVYLPVRCNTVIVDEDKGTVHTVLRAQPMAEADDAAKVLAEAAGLTFHKVL
jgi:LSD1 subclass zinc finger protein